MAPPFAPQACFIGLSVASQDQGHDQTGGWRETPSQVQGDLPVLGQTELFGELAQQLLTACGGRRRSNPTP